MHSKTTYPKEKIRILLLEGVHPVAIDLFKDHGYKSVEAVKSSLPETELLRKISGAHLLGIRSKTQLTEQIFKAADKLLGVGAFCIGTNQIDLNAAIRSGVAVFNSPYSNTRSVAEMVIGLSISLMRRIPEKNAMTHQGVWDKSSEGCKQDKVSHVITKHI